MLPKDIGFELNNPKNVSKMSPFVGEEQGFLFATIETGVECMELLT